MDYQAHIAALAGSVRKGVDISDLHVARLESDFSVGYRQDQTNFIGDEWFSIREVNQISGLVPRWSKELSFTDRAEIYRPGSIPAQSELKVDQPIPYVCNRYAFEMPLDEDIPFVADPGYNVEFVNTQVVTDVLQLHKEILLAKNYFTSASTGGRDVWATNWDGMGDKPSSKLEGKQFVRFDDDLNSSPLKTFKAAKLAIKRQVGLMPNTLVLGEQVYEVLRIHPELTNLFRNPQAAMAVPTKLNEQLLAQALDVDRILVGRSMYNTAPPDAPVSLDWIWGKHCWFGYMTDAGPMKPTAAINVSFNQPLGGYSTAIVQVPDLHAHTVYTQGFQCWAPVVMANDAGMMLANAIS